MNVFKYLPLSFCFIATFAMAEEGQKECPACLQQLAEGWVSALKSGDLEKMASLYDEGEGVVAVESSGRVRKGAAEIRDMYKAAFEELQFHKVDLDFERTHVEGKFGTTYFKLRALAEIRGNKAKIELYVQGTWVLRKEKKKGWVITQEHFSPIFGVERVKHLDPPDKKVQPNEGDKGEAQ